MTEDQHEPDRDRQGIPHAHDRYFRAGMQGHAEQEALVRALFPSIAALVADGDVQAVDGTFVDEDLRERHTDLLLRTRLSGQDAFVYVLTEHQSTVDPFMALRIMRYELKIWDRYLAEHPGTAKVPLILPAVIYQGDRRWTAPTDVRDILNLRPEVAEAVDEYLPRLRYRLDDLTQIDLAALKSRTLTPLLRLTLGLLMLAPGNPRADQVLEEFRDDVIAVASGPNGSIHLVAAILYIRSVSDVPADRLRSAASRLGPVVVEALMTTAELLRAEGRVEGHADGRAEGQVEGQAKTLLRLLEIRFGPVPERVRARVAGATVTELDVWVERVLTAASTDDVLA